MDSDSRGFRRRCVVGSASPITPSSQSPGADGRVGGGQATPTPSGCIIEAHKGTRAVCTADGAKSSACNAHCPLAFVDRSRAVLIKAGMGLIRPGVATMSSYGSIKPPGCQKMLGSFST